MNLARTRYRGPVGVLGCVLGIVGWSLAACASVATASDIEAEPILYSQAEPDNPITRLQQQIDAEPSLLEFDETFGYLRAVLQAVDVPESSQTLVYSKTSLQRNRIAPWRPRAIYFNDDLYVGYCNQGEVLEISTADPQLGTVFYTLRQSKQTKPRFLRQTDSCLICHGSSRNRGFPGHLVRSVYSDSGGNPVFSMGSHQIDQTSPFKNRWGGWYVTGTHGEQTHLGNLIVRGRPNPNDVDNADGQNVTDLSSKFTTSAYLTPHSDIVALMVLEHQAEMHNRIVRAGFQTRMALQHERVMKEALGEDEGRLYESTERRIKGACEPLVEYMLYSGEAELTDQIEGTSGFAAEFAQRGPRDRQGRSLRDFDLRRRVFKYPCSYLIDSEAMHGLPPEARKYVWSRLWDILTEQDDSEKFAHLSSEDRQAIREILQDTVPDLPELWRD
jgi:hypothetical protein